MSKKSLSNLGGNITIFSGFALIYLVPAMAVVAEIVFVALRLFGFIDWSWMWVIIWAPLLLDIALILLCTVFTGCGMVLIALGKEN